MQVTEAARQLAQAIQETQEYREYARLKEEIRQDAGIRALVDEYKRLQTVMQMRLLSGQGMEDQDGQRFQSLNVLLFSDPRTSG